MIGLVRRLAWGGFMAGALLAGGTGLAARVAPALGHELFAVRSGSMSPAIGVGDLAVVDRTRQAPPAIGDAVAYRVPSGTAVIHRVVGDDGVALETKGDANPTPDAGAVPPHAVVGPVVATIPLLGYLLGMLTMPSGVVSLSALLGTLLAVAWLIEGSRPPGPRRPVADAPVRTR